MGSPKKFIVQSNWKMHKLHAGAREWIEALGAASAAVPASVELIACVPLIHLRAAVSAARPFARLSIGTQNVHWDEAGAYTGETSAPMIADAGGIYCVVGHSERREAFGETDELVNRKARTLLKHGVSPIVCIGESIGQRERGLTFNQLERQVAECFEGMSLKEMQRTVVLYEPLWSIGTGANASAEQAQEAHRCIRDLIAGRFSDQCAAATRIMYGGSVKAHNVGKLAEGRDIDGVGVGSGSLDVNEFLQIVRTCSASNRIRAVD